MELTNKLLEANILTEDKIRKFPLRESSLRMTLKLYAVMNHIPYKLDIKGLARKNHLTDNGDISKYYLTDYGLEWLYQSFESLPQDYVRKVFGKQFTNIPKSEVIDYRTTYTLNNFRGVTGITAHNGTAQPAFLIITLPTRTLRFDYDNIALARQGVLHLSTQYPLESMTLYRWKRCVSRGKEYRVKEKIPLIVKASTDHLRGKGYIYKGGE